MPTRGPDTGEGNRHGVELGPPLPDTTAPLFQSFPQPCRQAGLAWLSVWDFAFCPGASNGVRSSVRPCSSWHSPALPGALSGPLGSGQWLQAASH